MQHLKVDGHEFAISGFDQIADMRIGNLGFRFSVEPAMVA